MPFLLDSRFWMLDSRKKTIIHHLKSKVLKVKRGFTLIELLVVIAIIGILASFAIASFNSAQAKGRDSRRKADLDAIKKALELYKTDTTGAKYYPGSTGDLTSGSVKYIKAVPTDTRTTSQAYRYSVAPTTAPGCIAAPPYVRRPTSVRIAPIAAPSNDGCGVSRCRTRRDAAALRGRGRGIFGQDP